MNKNFKKILSILSLSFSTQLFALHYEFVGYSEKVIFSGEKKLEKTQSAGAFTVQVLEEALAQGVIKSFLADEMKLVAVNDLKGDSNIEDYDIISDREMNVYGWCFSVDGVVGNKLPHEEMLNQDTAQLRWFYGYAHLDGDQWTDMCLPALKDRII